MTDKIDKEIFEQMQYATADKTAVALQGDSTATKAPNVTKEGVHDLLMFAGFTPGLGNIADAADALLYAFEGEFGNAAISAAAMIPFVGQAVSAKKALKVAKESGEEMIKLYRGVGKWHPGEMVKDGLFVGSGKASTRMTREGPKEMFYTASHKAKAEGYAGKGVFAGGSKNLKSRVLEFEVPKSYLEKFSVSRDGKRLTQEVLDENLKHGSDIIFEVGLPKDFLTKVHK